MVAANDERLEALAGELGTKVCRKPHSGAGDEVVAGDGEADGSRAEWTNHANEVCRTNREANASKLAEFEQLLGHGFKTAAARHEGAAIVRAGVANVGSEIESFKALTAPLALASEFEKLIAKLETLTDLESEFADLLDNGQMKALPASIGKIAKAELAVRGLSLHLGLRVCGKILQSEGGHGLT